MVLIPVPQLSSFPNYDQLEKKGANVHSMVKNGLIFTNLSKLSKLWFSYVFMGYRNETLG